MTFCVEHIGLAARDPSAMKSWCERVLGAATVYSDGHAPSSFLMRLPGGLLLEIYPAESGVAETSNNRLAGWRHLALRVDSIEAAREALASHDVELDATVKPAGGGGRVLFFKDPEGNLWHLVERPAGSVIG